MKILIPQNSLTTTLYKALDELDSKWLSYKGLLIPGSWPGQDDEAFIKSAIPAIKKAKEDKLPFLGICLGMQALGMMEGAGLIKMQKPRQGIYKVNGWWGESYESHWHRFRIWGEFPEYEVYETNDIIETMRLRGHPFFVGTQWHPEYQSSKKRPHPILKEFILHAKTS